MFQSSLDFPGGRCIKGKITTLKQKGDLCPGVSTILIELVDQHEEYADHNCAS